MHDVKESDKPSDYFAWLVDDSADNPVKLELDSKPVVWDTDDHVKIRREGGPSESGRYRDLIEAEKMAWRNRYENS